MCICIELIGGYKPFPSHLSRNVSGPIEAVPRLTRMTHAVHNSQICMQLLDSANSEQYQRSRAAKCQCTLPISQLLAVGRSMKHACLPPGTLMLQPFPPTAIHVHMRLRSLRIELLHASMYHSYLSRAPASYIPRIRMGCKQHVEDSPVIAATVISVSLGTCRITRMASLCWLPAYKS